MNTTLHDKRVFVSHQKSCTVLSRVQLTIGERIAVLRNRKGLTQAELARAAGLRDRTHLSRIESGDIAKPETETLFKLAEVLETSPEFLRFGDDRQSAGVGHLGEALDFSTGLAEVKYRMKEFGLMLIEIADRTERVGKHPIWDTPTVSAPTESRINDAPIEVQETFVFPIRPDEFIEKEYDYPQPLRIPYALPLIQQENQRLTLNLHALRLTRTYREPHVGLGNFWELR
jgi:transcriptional regulator with XRE-family HTH domain